MLLDEVNIKLKGGHGGPGKVSFFKGRFGGPDGGNGGKGGDVYIKVTTDLSALNQFIKTKSKVAENGEAGGSNKKFGKDGKDLEILMPRGTTIIDAKTREMIELNELDQRILICIGGKGGKGNFELRSSVRTTPMIAQSGLEGQEKTLELKLKFLADFGLIGLPNAGKSSLLNELTGAGVRVGDYPFTTTEPNLGVYLGKVIADIPGLIEGASSGKGLGIKFLKHIEKISLILHCLPADSDDILRDYKIVKNELQIYDEKLLKKKEIILLTKSDMVDEKTLKKQIAVLKKIKTKILPISIYDFDSIENLKKLL